MPGCVLCLRMIGLAFDCHDGTKEKLRPEQIERALKKVPSLLEITAFSLNFNGVLIGPQFPYVTHDLLVRIEVLLFPQEDYKKHQNEYPEKKKLNSGEFEFFKISLQNHFKTEIVEVSKTLLKVAN